MFQSSLNSLYSIFCGCLYGTAIHTSAQLYLKDQRGEKKARCYNMLSEGLSGGPSVLAQAETCNPGTDGG